MSPPESVPSSGVTLGSLRDRSPLSKNLDLVVGFGLGEFLASGESARATRFVSLSSEAKSKVSRSSGLVFT